MNDLELAQLLIKEVREALARGTLHYNKAGELLTTSEEIISCMLNEGEVLFKPVIPS